MFLLELVQLFYTIVGILEFLTLAKFPIPSSSSATNRMLLLSSDSVDVFSLAEIVVQSGGFSTCNSCSDWLEVGRFQ